MLKRKRPLDEGEVAKLLDQLTVLREKREAFHTVRQTLIEQQPEIGHLTAEIHALDEEIGPLEANIRESVLALGASVKGQVLAAVWNRGRTSWDTKRLEGFAAVHPEIQQFRTQGQPTVSIRKV